MGEFANMRYQMNAGFLHLISARPIKFYDTGTMDRLELLHQSRSIAISRGFAGNYQYSLLCHVD